MSNTAEEPTVEPSSLAVLSRELDGHRIGQRKTDGYVNATALCKAAGKQFGHYQQNKGTVEFVAALSRSIGIPMDRLIDTIKNGPNELRGTWVHPDIAVDLARWLSPEFAIQVAQWVRELLTTGRVEVVTFTGDALLDTIRTMHQTTGALVEIRQRQLDTERRLDTVQEAAAGASELAVAARQDASYAVGAANAAIRAVAAGLNYSTVNGYCQRVGLVLPLEEETALGRHIAEHCRKYGIEVGQTADQAFGAVNTYPDGVIADLVDQIYGAANR